VVQGFKNKCDIDGVIRAIDGCHIAVAYPNENAGDYVNRKGYHSIVS